MRVLIIAPHPDDDVIACAGLLMHAEAARILFVTDGERNPWPQRVKLRKLFIGDRDREAWAAMRRRETLESLARLGIEGSCARFLGFPDQRLMSLARRGERAPSIAIADEIRDFAPTLIVSPSTFDAHYDHRAIAWYAHQVARELVTYVVHGNAPQSRLQLTVELTPEEQAKKREAIQCHESQLLLGRGRFLSYATPREHFYRAEHELVRVESWMEGTLKRVRHAWFTCTTRRSH